jgi:hypothetical protein
MRSDNVIEFPRRSTRVIDVYPRKAGSVGIEAVVSLRIASRMLAKASNASKLCIYQDESGGLVTLEAHVSTRVAAKVLAIGKRAGILIRR